MNKNVLNLAESKDFLKKAPKKVKTAYGCMKEVTFRQEKDKVISAQNLIMVKKQKEKKKAGKRESKFIEEFQIDLKKLRMKFSSEN